MLCDTGRSRSNAEPRLDALVGLVSYRDDDARVLKAAGLLLTSVNRHGNRITRTRKTRYDVCERKASIQMRTGGEYYVECAFADGTESNWKVVNGVEVES
jgi:hypothetical protein